MACNSVFFLLTMCFLKIYLWRVLGHVLLAVLYSLRCMSGLTGLKEQGITNCVTLQFITNYDKLFLEKGEPSPRCDGFQMVFLLLLFLLLLSLLLFMVVIMK